MKTMYGNNLEIVNGKVIDHLEYAGNSDGNNIILNIYDNGENKYYHIPDNKPSILSSILNIKPSKKTLINRLRQYSHSRKHHNTRKKHHSSCKRRHTKRRHLFR